MTTISRTDLINDIAQITGRTKIDAKEIVDALFDRVTWWLAKDEQIRVSGFGTFKVMHRAAGKARNPRTGETIKTAASSKTKFTQAKVLREALNRAPDTERRVPRRA